MANQYYEQVVFLLDQKVLRMGRTRYNFWQALGDIGGFHDGLILLVKLLMSSISSIFFFNDVVNKNLYSLPESKRKN